MRRKIIGKLRAWKYRKYLNRDGELRNINFPYSKGWAFCVESNGGASNIFDATEHILSEKEFSRIYKRNCSSYWMRMGSGKFPNLDHFVETILPFQRVPFVIFCSDGDLTFPVDANGRSVNLILNHPLFCGLYAQNLDNTDCQDDKFMHIPIGLDLHTPRADGVGSSLFEEYISISESTSIFEHRKSSIFSDVNLNYTNRIRNVAFQLLKENKNFSFLGRRVSQLELWRAYSSHKYVLSLPGNGYDCHRTWEALGLGCRVITVTSPVDDLLKQFPVYIAKNVEELAEDRFYNRLEEFFECHIFSECNLSFGHFYDQI
jgi:hypothetical protein